MSPYRGHSFLHAENLQKQKNSLLKRKESKMQTVEKGNGNRKLSPLVGESVSEADERGKYE